MKTTRTQTATIHPELKKLLESCNGFKRVTEGAAVRCHIRVSKKQLWFLAYKSNELTGGKFTCEDAVGYKGRPCHFDVGKWNDGGVAGAECTASPVNGPFWIHYTESLKVEEEIETDEEREDAEDLEYAKKFQEENGGGFRAYVAARKERRILRDFQRLDHPYPTLEAYTEAEGETY